MKRIRLINRIIFLLTGLVAGYQIISGMDTYSNLTTFYFTISFGILLLACILLLLMGFESMENNFVAVIASLIPITLSLGMIDNKIHEYHTPYLDFIIVGFLFSIYFRFYGKGKIASLSLGLIHGISGIVIFLLPIVLILDNKVSAMYLFISFGGVIIGIGGLLFALSISGFKKLDRKYIELLFPLILFFTTAAFVIGLATK